LADLPRVGEHVQKDQPLLTVFAEGASLAEVESLLRQRANFVKETLGL
jgi:predicted ATP-grasp superfamily ATP-dependent carboligase